MTIRLSNAILAYALGILLTLSMTSALATEGGGSTASLGAENFLTGAAPPPGFYVLEYINHYRANRLNYLAGDAAVPGSAGHLSLIHI